MIQIITYDTSKYKEYPKTVYKISQLGEIQALDDFEICIIDLSSNNLWKNDGPNPNDINSRNDLLTLKEAIHNKKKSKILIILPQNIPFYYNYIYKRNGEYKFDDVKAGEYIVAFLYDGNQYDVTEFKKAGVLESENSDAVKTSIKFNNEDRTAGITEVFEVKESSVSGINIGLIKMESAIFSINKVVTRMSMTDPKPLKQ